MSDEKENKLQVTPAVIVAAMSGDLANAVVAATPGGIERQEKEGQTRFVNSAELPIQCPKEQLEKLGFVFGEKVDDLFIKCTMPSGWVKEATSHSMWSVIKDNKGRVRARVFYKAAFYDRRADMYLVTRYSLQRDYPKLKDPSKPDTTRFLITDCEQEIYCIGENTGDDWEEDDRLNEQGRLYLDEHYPEWKDSLAYWD